MHSCYFFSHELPKICALLPKKLLPYIQLSRPYHFAGGVVPCLIGLQFAGMRFDALYWHVLFLGGAFLILGAGATINDILDAKIDKSYHRSISRPIVSGRLSANTAVLYFLIQLVLAFFIWLQLPNEVKIMTFLELVLVCLYPLMKRITNFSQIYLGLIAGAPCIFSYYLFERKIDISIVSLWLALSIHCIIFDTFFEYAEYFHNKSIKAKSIAILVGAKPKIFLSSCIIMCLFFLIIAGIFSEKGSIYYLASFFSMAYIFYNVYSADMQNQSGCLKNFLRIQLSSVIIFLGAMANYYVS